MKFSQEFIKKLLSQDRQAFNQFYLETIDIFFRYIKSNYFVSDKDAEDIISDFYFKIRNNIHSYNTDYRFETWMWTVFKNTLKDSFKKQSHKYFSSFNTEENDVDFYETLWSEDNIIELLEKDYEFSTIQAVMDSIDEKAKEIINLKYIQELSNDEISAILWISNSNVRQRLSRALKKLKDKLEN